MDLVTRFALWMSTSLAALVADVATKSAPHATVVHNQAHTPPLLFALVGCFLWVLGLWHSRLLAIGAGLMFGGLCGNGGQLLLTGYATDWIPVGGWLTNVADISGALGLVCCFTGYVFSAFKRHTLQVEVSEA
jgi:lipoprotein signal peptidase